jgi:hypothetical protein
VSVTVLPWVDAMLVVLRTGQTVKAGELLQDITRSLALVCNGNLSFLVCDVKTLRAHPEVVKAPGIGKTLDLVRGKIWKIDERLYKVAEEPKALLQHQDADPSPKSTELDNYRRIVSAKLPCSARPTSLPDLPAKLGQSLRRGTVNHHFQSSISFLVSALYIGASFWDRNIRKTAK